MAPQELHQAGDDLLPGEIRRGAPLWSASRSCLSPFPPPAPSQGTCERGKGCFSLGSKGCSQQQPKMLGFSVSVVRGPLRRLGGLALPPACLTIFFQDKTQKLSQPLQHVPMVHLAHPNHTPTGWGCTGCTLRHLQDTPGSLGSQAPSLTLGMMFSSFPGSQHLLVWTQGACRSCPLAGHPFDFGLSGGGEPFGKEQKPSVVWVTSPWR